MLVQTLEISGTPTVNVSGTPTDFNYTIETIGTGLAVQRQKLVQ